MGVHFHSFQASFFLEKHQKPLGNGWFLKRTMKRMGNQQLEKWGKNNGKRAAALFPGPKWSHFFKGSKGVPPLFFWVPMVTYFVKGVQGFKRSFQGLE